MADSIPILVSLSQPPGTVAIKPLGPCRMGICEALEEFLVPVWGDASTTDIFIDLSRADAVDSTFIGFLVGLAKKTRACDRTALHLVSPSDPARQALSSTHVLAMFDVRDRPPQPPSEWMLLHAEPVSPDHVRDLVVKAHEALIQADERNAAEFGRVVDIFRAASSPKPRGNGGAPN